MEDRHKFDGKEDRNYHQKPFDEGTDPLPQIDDASAAKAERHASEADKETGSENQDGENGQQRDAAGYVNDINQTDARDTGDSTADWEAENNRTGRRK